MSNIDIATVIPYCIADSDLVSTAILSIIQQTYKGGKVKIYVVADDVPEETIQIIKEPFKKYRDLYFLKTSKCIGPYCITNSIVKYHTNCEYLAIQDADDFSYPTRFERQADKLSLVKHCSASMKQVPMPNYKGNRHLREPTLLCGVRASNIPLGRYINGTRMIHTQTFRELNGFPSMFCSGDLCFDNTINALKIPSYAIREVLAERRLHARSLTNNPNSDRQAPIRKTCQKILLHNLRKILESPTIETARSYGGLDFAEPLEAV
jgi:hypothetical protein